MCIRDSSSAFRFPSCWHFLADSVPSLSAQVEAKTAKIANELKVFSMRYGLIIHCAVSLLGESVRERRKLDPVVYIGFAGQRSLWRMGDGCLRTETVIGRRLNAQSGGPES